MEQYSNVKVTNGHVITQYNLYEDSRLRYIYDTTSIETTRKNIEKVYVYKCIKGIIKLFKRYNNESN